MWGRVDTKRSGIVRRAAPSAAYAPMNRPLALAPADPARGGLGQGDGRGPREPAAGAGDDHRGALEIYSCHFVAHRWLAGSTALVVLIRAGPEIHRSVSCAK